MTYIRFLFFFLLHRVSSEEAVPVFKAMGTVIEMGYCFGVDYILVYRCTPGGDQLLGNSSTDGAPVTPPADLQGRIHINQHQHLLGLQISNLTAMDSGVYRRECWQDQTLTSQHTQQLYVCDEEGEAEEVIVKEQDGQGEFVCNSTSIGLEGTSVRWYHEMYPSYKLTLFLDSSKSLDPLVEELRGVVEVRDSGALLLLDKSMLKNNQHFYCLVIRGKHCLSFQNMYLPDISDSRDMYASVGDSLVLNCPSNGNHQQWHTPLGSINDSSVKDNQMHISSDDKSESFSLVIPYVSEDHGGDYSCMSSSFELHYMLVLCPKEETQENFVSVGGSALLHCDVSKGDSQSVQWHRLQPSREYELIYDSHDKTVAIPEDLRGRMTLLENGTSLRISHLEMKDQGVYWCVVLRGPQLMEDGDEYEDDYDEENAETGEDDYEDDSYWPQTHRCVLKQKTILNFLKKTPADLETSTPPDEPEASNVTAYAVGGGLVGLLVVGVIVAVIAIKKRANASSASRSGHDQGHKMNVDPGCTERLTNNDEHGA